MFGSRLSLKSIAFLLLAFSFSRMTSAHDALRSVAGGDEITMASSDDYHDRRLTWSIWYNIMYDLLPPQFCVDKDGMCRSHCPPPPPHCHTQDANYYPESCKCLVEGTSASTSGDSDGSGSSGGGSGTGSTETTSAGDSGSGSSSAVTFLWMIAAGLAVVGMVGAGIIMRKRRNAAQEDLGSGHSLTGSVNNRAALLVGGGAAAVAGAGAALPTFLSVPSMRRNPSGFEVARDGAVLEQSPSNYYEMEGAVDASELPEGVDLSPSGTLTPYAV